MVIVLALAFLLSAIVTIYTLFRSGDTEVPNLIGKPEAEAQKLAEQAGLRVKIQRRNDASVPANLVIETHPAAARAVKKDFEITMVVSSGPVQTKSEVMTSGPQPPGRRVRARNAIKDAVRDAVRDLVKVTASVAL